MFSDTPTMANKFQSNWDVVNTHFHKFPFLDVTAPDPLLWGEFEFTVCSDVLEHIPPPYEKGIAGLYSILRPGGFAVVSVPVNDISSTKEHYPGITSFSLDENKQLTWSDGFGNESYDTSPELHGGDGVVLAFRQFKASDFINSLYVEGFSEVTEIQPSPEFGVFEIELPGVFLARK